MNRKGYSIVELLAILIVVGLVVGLSYTMLRGTFSSTDSQMDKVNDSEILDSARVYALENGSFNSQGYVCVRLKDLIDYGYIKVDAFEDKLIKVIRNNFTMVIDKVEYVYNCV